MRSSPPMKNEAAGQLSRFVALATFTLVVVILRVAKDVMIPIALAALLAFLLSPLVVRLVQWGLNRTLAVVITTILAFSVFLGVGWTVTSQALNVMQELPQYEQNIEAKISRLTRPGTPSTLSEAAGMVKRIQQDLKATPPDGSAHAAVAVEVEAPGSSMFDMTRSILLSLLGPLATTGIVGVFMVAMLLQRDDLRSRLLKMTHSGGLHIEARAFDDAAHRVLGYLSMQLVVNATYGIPVGLGLYLIGIPHALLWGLLSTLLRFVPYIGVWVAAAFPLGLALAVDPGWMKLAWTLGLFMVAEAVTANIVEVWVYGVRTGINSLGLMVAAVFWTWLWGPAGLFLSVPLTVCLVVLGKEIPRLKIFTALLSAEPPAPAAR
jgi:predicted PurR-regulated permease PerM